MWQGLLALKNDSAAVQMHFVGGNPGVAADALSRHSDGTAASLLRIAQRMRLEPAQLDQVHRKMKVPIFLDTALQLGELLLMQDFSAHRGLQHPRIFVMH